MAYEFDIDKIQDYVKDLCERNADVQHNVNGIKSFARFHSSAEVNELKKNAGQNVVIVAEINGRRVGHKDDKVLQREMVLRFASFAEKNGDVEGAKRAAIKKAEEVMFDFMTEMERKQEEDLDQDIPCGIMHYLQPENFSWEPIEDQPWLLNHYGWDLTVPFRVWIPQHNPGKWGGDALPDEEEPAPYDPGSLVARFRVGAVGAPMAGGDTEYTNELLIDHRFICLINGVAVSQLTDDPDERYCTKALESDTIQFHGAVVNGEVVEIYRS